jgi:phage virion morphogenesis protein
MATIVFNDDALQAALTRVDQGLGDMSEPMNQIGEALVQSTQDRIERGETPDGDRLAPRSQATLDGYARKNKSMAGGPLRLSDDMRNAIYHDYGDDFTEVGSGVIQAAMMQFGGTKSQFPNLWGDIPARPFIGFSEADKTDAIEIVEDWLLSLSQ